MALCMGLKGGAARLEVGGIAVIGEAQDAVASKAVAVGAIGVGA